MCQWGHLLTLGPPCQDNVKVSGGCTRYTQDRAANPPFPPHPNQHLAISTDFNKYSKLITNTTKYHTYVAHVNIYVVILSALGMAIWLTIAIDQKKATKKCHTWNWAQAQASKMDNQQFRLPSNSVLRLTTANNCVTQHLLTENISSQHRKDIHRQHQLSHKDIPAPVKISNCRSNMNCHPKIFQSLWWYPTANKHRKDVHRQHCKDIQLQIKCKDIQLANKNISTPAKKSTAVPAWTAKQRYSNTCRDIQLRINTARISIANITAKQR